MEYKSVEELYCYNCAVPNTENVLQESSEYIVSSRTTNLSQLAIAYLEQQPAAAGGSSLKLASIRSHLGNHQKQMHCLSSTLYDSIMSSLQHQLDHSIHSEHTAAGSDPMLWNERFQKALDMSEDSYVQKVEKVSVLSDLSTDFMDLAIMYAKLIVSELFIEEASKTMKTCSHLGGIAGGEKYIVRGLLLKLAIDKIPPGSSGYLYGNQQLSFELASKAAGHELVGANSYFKFFKMEESLISAEGSSLLKEFHLKDISLRVPMQALVDYLGFRVVAMPLLPLSGDRAPVYGSNDANIVHTDDPVFNEIMRLAGMELFLAEHQVKKKLVHSAGDVEGHIGLDGRRYLLDLARSFPPESPIDTPHLPSNSRSVFFRQLRPEFLQNIKDLQEEKMKPLSPDAFTNWGLVDMQEHNSRVQQATIYLISTCIPSFVTDLLEMNNLETIQKFRVSEEMHSRGINLRHIGYVRHLLRKFPQTEKISRVLLAEMVSRCTKQMLRSGWRVLKETAPNYFFKMKDCAVQMLNLLTGSHKAWIDFWEKDLPSEICNRYGNCAIHDSETRYLFFLTRSEIIKIISYVCQSTGVVISENCLDQFLKDSNAFIFNSSDVSQISPTIKKIAVIDFSEGEMLRNLAFSEDTPFEQRPRILLDSLNKLNQTAINDPLNHVCISHISRIKAILQGDEEAVDSIYSSHIQDMLPSASKQNEQLVSLFLELLEIWRERNYRFKHSAFGGATSLELVLDTLAHLRPCLNQSVLALKVGLWASCVTTFPNIELVSRIHSLFAESIVSRLSLASRDSEVRNISKKLLVFWNQFVSGSTEASRSLVEEKQIPDIIQTIEFSEGLSEQLGADLALILFNSSKQSMKQEAFRLYCKNPSIFGQSNWVWDNGGFRLSQIEIDFLCQLLVSNSPLTHLSVSNCHLHDEGIEAIANALETMLVPNRIETIYAGTCINIKEIIENKVSSIDFEHLGFADITWLCSALCHNSSLHAIRFKDTHLGAKTVEKLGSILTKLAYLREIQIVECKLTKKSLKSIAEQSFDKLESIHLEDIGLEDASLQDLGKILSKCDRLKNLNLSKNRSITDSGVKSFAASFKSEKTGGRIVELSISHCKEVGSKGLIQLSQVFVSLQTFRFSDCNLVTDDGVLSIVTNCPDLRCLDLSSCTNISDKAVASIGKHLSKLENLTLRNCSLITDESLVSVVANCSRLEVLDLTGCILVTHKSLQLMLRQDLQHLKTLTLVSCLSVSIDDMFKDISRSYSTIRTINLSRCSIITNTGLGYLAKACLQLESLNLNRCITIGDEGMKYIGEHCHVLTHLDIAWCGNITEKGIEFIASGCQFLEWIDVTLIRGKADLILQHISRGCQNLTSLSIDRVSYLSNNGIAQLIVGCPHLKCLHLGRGKSSDELSAIAFINIARGLPLLETLNMSKFSTFSDSCLSEIVRKCKKLRYLNLNKCSRLSDEALIYMSRYCTELERLDLSECGLISDKGLSILISKCIKLRRLSLEFCNQITNQSMISISRYGQHLEELNISNCTQISDQGLMNLASGCERLKTLIFLSHGSCVSNSVLEQLKKVGINTKTMALDSSDMKVN